MAPLCRFLSLGPIAAALCFALPAWAGGPYDGTWRVEAQPAGEQLEQGQACPYVQFDLQIRDNQVQANLAYISPVDMGVIETSGPGSSALTGSVDPNGRFSADWMGLHGAGVLSGENGRLMWVGACGPRSAELTRVH